MTTIAHGEIGRQLTQATTTALNNNTDARGRVRLDLIFRYYASGNNAHLLCYLNHLQRLVLRGDRLESFHSTWNVVLSELSEPPDPKLLQYLYFQQVQQFKPLTEDVAHYRRARYPGSPDCSFEWLWEASNRYLLMKREEYMHESLSRGLNGVFGQAAPALEFHEGDKKPNGGKGECTTTHFLKRPQRRRPRHTRPQEPFRQPWAS